MNNSIFKYGSLNKILHSKLAKSVWFIGLSLSVVILNFYAVLFNYIDSDSSYYLSIVERLNDGLQLYKDINTVYAPFYFYFLLSLKRIFDIGINYEFFLTVHFLIQFISAYVVYRISIIIINRKDYSFYAAYFFIISSHWNFGNNVLLETPSLLFGLVSILILIRKPKSIASYLIAGTLASLSFLTKQYGLVFFGLLFFLTLFDEEKMKHILYMFSGFAIPIIICYMIWGDRFNVVFTGNNYGLNGSIWDNLSQMVLGIYDFIVKVFPVLVPVILIIPFIIKHMTKCEKQYIAFLIFGLLGFMLQFYFEIFPHYYLYMIPFAILLVFMTLRYSFKYRVIIYPFLIITILITLYSTYYKLFYKLYIKHPEWKESQYQMSRQILNKVEKNKTLFIEDSWLIDQYYLTNLLPPKCDYSFGPGMNELDHIQQIISADYVLTTVNSHSGFDKIKIYKEFRNRKAIILNDYFVLYK
jgi:hypothetical protein